jgi:recombination protein RecT
MSNAVAVREKKTVDQFVMEILPPEKRESIFRGMPGHIKPAVFERNLHNCLMINPALIAYPASLVYREVSKAAALGLLLDPALGEAYIIEAWNGKAKRLEPQLRIGYRGMMKLAKQTGSVEKIYCREVCKNDTFIPEMGTEEKLVHRPMLFGDRGPIIGYYAVIKFKDGGFDFEPMSIDQIHGIRDRSDGWKAFKAGKISSTPWSTDEDEMAKKTTIRRLVKRQSLSSEMAEAIEIEDKAEFSEMRAIMPPPPPPPPEEPQLQQIQTAAAISDGGPVPPDNSPSDPITEVDETDWEAEFGAYVAELAAHNDYEALEKVRNTFMEKDMMPRSIQERALEAYELHVDALQREEDKREAEKAAAENGKAKRTTKKSTAAQRGAEGGGDVSAGAGTSPAADQASPPPPPPSDDDTFPGDMPPPPPVESNAPSPEEIDEGLAAQGDFAADFRQQVRAKMRSAGYKRCMMWLKSKEEGMVDIAMKMPDREALSAEGKRIDEERAKAEQQ